MQIQQALVVSTRHPPALFPVDFRILDISCKWGHAVGGLLGLASFTQPQVLKFISVVALLGLGGLRWPQSTLVLTTTDGC